MEIKKDQELLVMIALRVLYEEAVNKKRDLQPSRIKKVYEDLFGNNECEDYRTITNK